MALEQKACQQGWWVGAVFEPQIPRSSECGEPAVPRADQPHGALWPSSGTHKINYFGKAS